MPSVRINKELNDQMYFLTITVKRWYYILDRYNRWGILADCLRFMIENRQLKIYGYVFMINHIHMIVQSPDVSGFVRDFKQFTTKEIKKNLKKTEPKAVELFENNGKFELWKKTNMPELIESEKFFLQKLSYIHSNPVKREYVREARDWMWSSAIDYESDEKGMLPVSIGPG